MAALNLTLDLPTVADAQRVINGAAFPLLAQAVRAIANQASYRWKDSVNHAKLWSGEKAPYIDSIKIRYLSDFRAEVYSDYKYAEQIETGRPSYDLKQMLNTSTKVRRTKAGRRFLVIPMRQNTPGNEALAPSMPTSVYELAREMKPSVITMIDARRSGEVTLQHPLFGMMPSPFQTPFMSNMTSRSAHMVARAKYDWGGRMKGADLKAAGLSKQDQRRYAGMVRMAESSGGSSYLTFRVMMEGSSGWVIRAKPGLFLARGVVEQLQPLATAAIAEAMRRTSQS